jgi:hypothetical protein
MKRRRLVAALAAVPLLLGASECGGGGMVKMAGTVVNRDFTGAGENIVYRLQVRKADGSTLWVRETFGNWSRCERGDSYPNCKYPNSKAA